ncbi:MAG: hypothetical protein Q4C13_03730, partial [Clostridia bacterium]|nr:hypothetical protein [Clostridia bacterium]
GAREKLRQLKGAQWAALRALNNCPGEEEMASVCFLGEDRGSRAVSYASLLIDDIEFTEPELIGCVAEALKHSVDAVKTYGSYQHHSGYLVRQAVRITLKDGRTLSRMIYFSDGKELNALRRENAAYRQAITLLPPDDSVRTVSGNLSANVKKHGLLPNYNTPELFELCEYYFGEQREDGVLVPYAHHDPDRYITQDYYEMQHMNYTPVNEKQAIGTLSISGYIGTQRYADTISITLETPRSAAAFLRLKNRYADDADSRRLAEAFARAKEADFEGYFALSISLINLPMENGVMQSASFDWYDNYEDDYDSPNTLPEMIPLMEEFVEILQRGVPTDDVSGLIVKPHFSIYWPVQYSHAAGDDLGAEGAGTAPPIDDSTKGGAYLGFAPEDAARIVEIVGVWSAYTRRGYQVETAGDPETWLPSETPSPNLPAPTPTLTPTP